MDKLIEFLKRHFLAEYRCLIREILLEIQCLQFMTKTVLQLTIAIIMNTLKCLVCRMKILRNSKLK